MFVSDAKQRLFEHLHKQADYPVSRGSEYGHLYGPKGKDAVFLKNKKATKKSSLSLSGQLFLSSGNEKNSTT